METIHTSYINNTDGVRNPVIVLPTCKGTMIIPVYQIIRIQSISNYSKLFFIDACPAAGGGRTLVVAKVLRWFQEQATLCSFVRVHRTHFVNISFIKSYRAGSLFLHNNETIVVAKRKKAGLAEQLNNLNTLFIHESADNTVFNIKKIMAA